MNKYAKFVRNTLSERELLEQLAEECNELAKATLKRIRAEKMSSNVTPTAKLEAWDNFIEEQKDVISVLWLLTGNERYAYIDGYPKIERWAKRLGYKESGGAEGIEMWLNSPCANEPENPPADKHVDLQKISGKVCDNVNHPDHYNHGKIEVIDFIEDQHLGFHLGNAVKYISRAGRKDPARTVEDLRKAAWYLNRQVERLEMSLGGQK